MVQRKITSTIVFMLLVATGSALSAQNLLRIWRTPQDAFGGTSSVPFRDSVLVNFSIGNSAEQWLVSSENLQGGRIKIPSAFENRPIGAFPHQDSISILQSYYSEDDSTTRARLQKYSNTLEPGPFVEFTLPFADSVTYTTNALAMSGDSVLMVGANQLEGNFLQFFGRVTYTEGLANYYLGGTDNIPNNYIKTAWPIPDRNTYLSTVSTADFPNYQGTLSGQLYSGLNVLVADSSMEPQTGFLARRLVDPWAIPDSSIINVTGRGNTNLLPADSSNLRFWLGAYGFRQDENNQGIYENPYYFLFEFDSSFTNLQVLDTVALGNRTTQDQPTGIMHKHEKASVTCLVSQLDIDPLFNPSYKAPRPTPVLVQLRDNESNLLWETTVSHAPTPFEVTHANMKPIYCYTTADSACILTGSYYDWSSSDPIDVHSHPFVLILRDDGPLTVVEDSTTYVQEPHPTVLNLQMYPNPTRGELHFEGDFRPGEALHLRVLDLSGRAVTEKTLRTATIQLELPFGVYIVELRQGEKLGRRKLVVQ